MAKCALLKKLKAKRCEDRAEEEELADRPTDRTEPQHRIAIICATIAYPALENFGQKSMIFISELTKRTYRFKRITSLNISKNL